MSAPEPVYMSFYGARIDLGELLAAALGEGTTDNE